jgi:succinate dehydrogenase assembly factor 2
MLDEPDWDIFYWSVEKKEPPARWKGSAILEE